MRPISRRKLITTGIAATAGVAGVAAAARLAERYGLIPPDHGGNLRSRRDADLRRATASDDALAGREVPSQHDLEIAFRQRNSACERYLQAAIRPGGFSDWRLSIGGMVAEPASLSALRF